MPTPGDPVIPMTQAWPVCGASAAITSRSAGCPSSTSEMSRATARGAPARAAFDERGDVDGAAWHVRQPAGPVRRTAGTRMTSASPWPPPPQRAAAPTPPPRRFELEGEVQGDPRAGHADRVAQGDRTAVDVDLVGVDPQLLGRGQPDGRERLVDLDEVEVGRGDALACAGAGDGPGRLLLEGGVRSGHHAVGADLGEPGQAELLGLGLAHHDDGSGAVGDLRGRAGRDGAGLAERGAQPRRGTRSWCRPGCPRRT